MSPNFSHLVMMCSHASLNTGSCFEKGILTHCDYMWTSWSVLTRTEMTMTSLTRWCHLMAAKSSMWSVVDWNRRNATWVGRRLCSFLARVGMRQDCLLLLLLSIGGEVWHHNNKTRESLMEKIKAKLTQTLFWLILIKEVLCYAYFCGWVLNFIKCLFCLCWDDDIIW